MLRRHHALRLAAAAASRAEAGMMQVAAAPVAVAASAAAAVPPPPIAAALAAAPHQAARRFAASASTTNATPRRGRWSLSAAAAAALGVAAAATTTAIAAAPDANPEPTPPTSTNLFTRAEVRKHRTMADRVWVTHGTAVYDVTDFVSGHPGGAGRLMLAAGGALEPFWKTYPQHHKPYVLKLLERYRIGELDPNDAEKDKAAASATDAFDPYAREPERHPALRPLTLKPYNAETPPELLSGSYVTPTDLFYVRHHFPVPEVDPAKYALTVQVWDAQEEGGGGGKEGGGDDDKSGGGSSSDGNKAPRGAPREVLRLTLDELKTKFPRHEITAVMQCTGNRRTEMRDETVAAAAAEAASVGGDNNSNKNTTTPPPPPKGKVVGLDWTVGGIGNAQWAGARLSDVLRAAGVKDGDPRHAHVHFVGIDGDEAGQQRYAASVPARLVGLGGGSNFGDALLAYEMNGAELPRDHGFPVRVVVPGVTGARSVKWVSEILAAPFECQGQWQQRDYKAFSPGLLREQPANAAGASSAPASASASAPDWTSAPPIHEMPISSAICEPAPGTKIPISDGYVAVKGWAWSGGGQAVIRVDLSPDGGKTWVAARLLPAPGAPDVEAARASAKAQGLEAPFVYPTGQEPGRAWGWTLWEADVPLPEVGAGTESSSSSAPLRELELCVKATDSTYNTQPESSLSIWNPRGVVNNAWHRVRVLLVPDEEEAEEEEEEKPKAAAAA
jgi:sulfite oxidase